MISIFIDYLKHLTTKFTSTGKVGLYTNLDRIFRAFATTLAKRKGYALECMFIISIK